MKPQFQFYFTDDPQRVATDPREHTAHLLRAYRKQRARFTLRRVGLHHYRVQILLSPSGAIAVLKAES